MSSDDAPPPPLGADGSNAKEEEKKGGRRWKTWHLVTATFIAFILGFAVAPTEGPEETEPTAVQTQTPTPTPAGTTPPVPSPMPEVTSPAPAPPPSPPAVEGPAETATAGQYRFTDIQVREDFAGDFSARAQVTNTGEAVQAAIWTISLLSDGSVVGTVTGTAQDFGAGETRTVEFAGTDPFSDFDEVRVQVDTEF